MQPEDVAAATHRIAAHVHRTPVLTSRRLDERVGARVFLKCENTQRAGAFKVRGAFNALLQLPPAQAAAGVITYSSGNHAQAIALAAGELGIPATIVMPHDAPEVKVAATKGYGAAVVRYDRYAQTREQIGADLARERGLTLIPPYDHPHIIAGQGTAAAELLAQAHGLDVVLTPLGGGGLLAGTILAAREAAPAARIYGVEPEAGDDGLRSLRAGRIVHIDTPRTIADGAQTQALGEWTFPIIAGGAADVLTVSDEALREAMRVLATTTKLVAEPTGVLALAGLLTHTGTISGGRIGVIVSGGNVDLDRYAALIATQ
ncbi:threo-3-hydroxy-L-aspartate ammonia-lyase [Pseudactinotalea sp. Z1739]|uniref:threo-3-hydroxy-L-aspartate ammonia-lyase n=1 Tax=Pseudactinotalea sp. Z1739 TaxID=3413028 RepID=UPI003C7A07CA